MTQFSTSRGLWHEQCSRGHSRVPKFWKWKIGSSRCQIKAHFPEIRPFKGLLRQRPGRLSVQQAHRLRTPRQAPRSPTPVGPSSSHHVIPFQRFCAVNCSDVQAILRAKLRNWNVLRLCTLQDLLQQGMVPGKHSAFVQWVIQRQNLPDDPIRLHKQAVKTPQLHLALGSTHRLHTLHSRQVL